MKNTLYPLTMILMIAILGITCAGCASQPAQSPPTQTPMPEVTAESILATVQKMIERMNAGDIEGSLAYFADDAVTYIIGLPPTGIEVYAGKEQIRALWQDSVDNHFQWEAEITSVDGNIVFVKAKTWHDFTRQLEVAPLEYIDVYEVVDGKITTYGTTITADALAKFKPAFAKVIPPEEPASPSNEQPVSEMTVTFEKGACNTSTPMALQAGEVTVNVYVKDQNSEKYALTYFTLDQDKDILDLMASTIMPAPPSWSNMFSFDELDPGESKTYSINIEEGPVYLICWSKPPDLPIGNAGPIDVKE